MSFILEASFLRALSLLLSFFILTSLQSQELSNYRTKYLLITQDTLLLDTLSIIPSSEVLQEKSGTIIPKNSYQVDYPSSKIYFEKELKGQEVKISYRVFPLLFTKEYSHKSKEQIEQEDIGLYNYFTIKEDKKNEDIFSLSGLNKNGSISRGVNFGNNQDLSVNSNLDLQLSGRITDDVSIQAAISDNNLPIQADGNTQQLQEFDRVFIRLFTEKSSLIAGDYRITRPSSYFMNLNKKVQGGGFSTEYVTKRELDEKDNGVIKTSFNAAISRGKFSRNIIPGEEGNQGPYQLRGDEGEQFIIVLSGTERVYVNGRLMKRGQDNDYVIDYNTAELTFTPNQIINKDLRIVVEFQYSEQNYARSVFFMENQYKKEKLQIDFNLYSEQDNKNRPLQQDLTDEEKRFLTDIGDKLDSAVISGIDTSEFENDKVRYKLIDTLGAQVLVFSKDPDSAIYSARFSRVLSGGDYNQVQSDANGRVFEFAGFGEGTHSPIIRLITPKQRQMVTLGGSYQFSNDTKLSVEGAFTNNDLNTFSEENSNDDQSYGMKLNFVHSQSLKKRDSLSSSKWNSAIFYEQRGRNFQFVERYRDVEFDRDWNIREIDLEGNEYLVRATTGLSNKNGAINYEFGSFTKGNDYEGIKNGFSGNYNKGGFSLQSRGSYLTTEAVDNSKFLRHYTTATQEVLGFKVGGYLEEERIIFNYRKTDSITQGSFDRVIWKGFIEKGDSASENSYRLSYSEIYDHLPDNERLVRAQRSSNYDFEFSMAKNRNSRLSGKATYRSLKVERQEFAVDDEENTLLGRLQYDLKAYKGFISSNTFYQIGSGLENRREFSFLEVNDGQGTHLWRDFNGNGIKELDEFQVAGANNITEANYIRVFTPTNDFIRVFNNQFNQILFLKPNALLSGKKGWKKFVGKFSNKAAFRVERETRLEEDIYNPFNTDVSDDSLISINSSFANTFYFNRLNPKFGAEFYFLNNTGKSLLTNGFESRRNIQQELRARYNITRIYSAEGRLTRGERATASDFFDTRNFTIERFEIEPKFIYQPSVRYRLTVSAIYTEKENTLITGNGERSEIQTASAEFRFNEAQKGSFSFAARYIFIDFNAPENNPLAFEMLEGLTAGQNITWDIRWQRNLANNLQLNLSYGGRKSDGIRTIHTGGMQVRAFF